MLEPVTAPPGRTDRAEPGRRAAL